MRTEKTLQVGKSTKKPDKFLLAVSQIPKCDELKRVKYFNKKYVVYLKYSEKIKLESQL